MFSILAEKLARLDILAGGETIAIVGDMRSDDNA